MLVVENIKTHRLVYREEPDFAPGYGIQNAVLLDLGNKEDFEEIKVTPTQWEAELQLRQQEQPPTFQAQIDDIRQRLTMLEKNNH